MSWSWIEIIWWLLLFPCHFFNCYSHPKLRKNVVHVARIVNTCIFSLSINTIIFCIDIMLWFIIHLGQYWVLDLTDFWMTFLWNDLKFIVYLLKISAVSFKMVSNQSIMFVRNTIALHSLSKIHLNHGCFFQDGQNSWLLSKNVYLFRTKRVLKLLFGCRDNCFVNVTHHRFHGFLHVVVDWYVG